MTTKTPSTILFIGADSEMKSSLQMLFSKMKIKTQYCEPLQAVGRVVTNEKFSTIVWYFKYINKQNQKVLLTLAEIKNTTKTPVLILCPPARHKEIAQFGFKLCLPIPVKGIDFYKTIQKLTAGNLVVPEKYVKYLSNLKFFDEFSHDALLMFILFGKFKDFKLGETVFKAGYKGTHFAILLQGLVEVVVSKHFEQVVDVVEPGMCFGELALIEDKPRFLNLVAKTDIKTLLLPTSALEQMEDSVTLEVYKSLTLSLAHKVRYMKEHWKPEEDH